MILFIINIANLVVVCCANLAARYHELNPKTGDGGSHNTKLAATSRRGSQGRAFDHKQALPRGNPYFFRNKGKKQNSLLYKKMKIKKDNNFLLSIKIKSNRALRHNTRTRSLRVFLLLTFQAGT